MNINNISISKLIYDNSLKKIISRVNYNKKDIFIKLKNIIVTKYEKKNLYFKNNEEIKEMFFSINNYFNDKINIKNILDIDLNKDELNLEYLIDDNVKIENKLQDLVIFLSHIECENENLKCKLYIVKIL